MDLTKALTLIANDIKLRQMKSEMEPKLTSIDFNKPLFSGPDVSAKCNPVTGRLIIFFTDILMPFFLNNITKPETFEGETNMFNATFSTIFNFIFYHTFDEYSENEKKWVIQQINIILSKLPQKYHAIFKQYICINLDATPFEVKRLKGGDFGVKLHKDSVHQTKLIEEFKKVMKRCLPFWKIVDNKDSINCDAKPINPTEWNIFSSQTQNNFLYLIPIKLIPSGIPIKKEIAEVIFYTIGNFSKIESVIMQKTSTATFLQIFQDPTSILFPKKKNNERDPDEEMPEMIFMKLLIILKIKYQEIGKKIQFYPETYDEMYTLFSYIPQTTIDQILDDIKKDEGGGGICGNDKIRMLLLPWEAPYPK
jgi:hypothetical protein